MGYAFLLRNYRADTGKWLTQGLIGYPDGWNNFAYCGNMPGITYDIGGSFWSWGTSCIGAAVSAAGHVADADCIHQKRLQNLKNSNYWNWRHFMSKKSLMPFIYNILGFTIGAFVFIFSQVFILKFTTKSELITCFLSEQIQNQKIIGDIILVISSIIPLLLFSIIISLFRRARNQ